MNFKNYLWGATLAGTIGVMLSSCCEPKETNSLPQVMSNSYNDTIVKDAIDIEGTIDPLDSGYYGVYSLDIKNTGSEADTFYLSYRRVRNGYEIPLTVQQYVKAGEVKTFTTYGPLPSNALDSAKVNLYSFFVKTPDSVSLFVLQPTINIHYAKTPNGAEQCGSPGKDLAVDPLKLQHK
ncbi:MAG: hypothetical protein WCH46_01140 [bacterium]